jgi:hypothetical protein
MPKLIDQLGLDHDERVELIIALNRRETDLENMIAGNVNPATVTTATNKLAVLSSIIRKLGI